MAALIKALKRISFAALAALALAPSSAFAAFGIESTTESGISNGTTLTFAHTVTAANLLIVTCGVGTNSSATPEAVITGITFNGDALTHVVSGGVNGTWGIASIWRRDSPDIATGNVVVTFNPGQTQGVCGASGLTDANLTLGATNIAAGTTDNPTVTITSTSGDFVIGAIGNDVGPVATLAVTSPGVELWEQEDVSSDSDLGAQRVTASGASTAVTWTSAVGGEHWAVAGVAISGTGGAASGLLLRRRRN